MKIVCPDCASQYELDAAKIGPDGRKVRCAACKTLWHVEAPQLPEGPTAEETQALLNEELARASLEAAEAAAQAAGPGPEPAAPGETSDDAAARDLAAKELAVRDQAARDAAPRKRGKGRSRKAQTRPLGQRLRGAGLPLALCAASLVLIGATIWQREFAVKIAPQLAGVFETIGLQVNVRGLTLSAVESGVVDEGQGRFLVVEGDIINIRQSIVPVPAIEVMVRDGAGQTLYTWTTEAPRPSLEPSELMRFRARLAQPPENGQNVQVRFVSQTGLAKAH